MCPSMNHAYPSDKWGRRFKSKELVVWEKEFHVWCLANLQIVNEARAQFENPLADHVVEINCDYYFKRESVLSKQKRPKRNDLSNRVKHLHDAVAAAIWLDDSYFWITGASKYLLPEGKEQEYVNVELEWVRGPWMSEVAT